MKVVVFAFLLAVFCEYGFTASLYSDTLTAAENFEHIKMKLRRTYAMEYPLRFRYDDFAESPRARIFSAIFWGADNVKYEVCGKVVEFDNPVRDMDRAMSMIDGVEFQFRDNPEELAYLFALYSVENFRLGERLISFRGGIVEHIKNLAQKYGKFMPKGAAYSAVAMQFANSVACDNLNMVGQPFELQSSLFRQRCISEYAKLPNRRRLDFKTSFVPEFVFGSEEITDALYFGAEHVAKRRFKEEKTGIPELYADFKNPAYDWSKAIGILDAFERKFKQNPNMIAFAYERLEQNKGGIKGWIFRGKIIDEIKRRRAVFDTRIRK